MDKVDRKDRLDWTRKKGSSGWWGRAEREDRIVEVPRKDMENSLIRKYKIDRIDRAGGYTALLFYNACT